MKYLNDLQIAEYLSEHLPYELMMLRHAMWKLNEHQEQLEWNVLYESFVVHARNLYKFLTNGEDVQACKFVPGFGSKADGFSYLQKLDAQVLHLSPNRPRLAQAKMQIGDVKACYEWIEEKFAKFVAGLTEEKSKLWSVPAIDRVTNFAQVFDGSTTAPLRVHSLGPQPTNTSSDIVVTISEVSPSATNVVSSGRSRES